MTLLRSKFSRGLDRFPVVLIWLAILCLAFCTIETPARAINSGSAEPVSILQTGGDISSAKQIHPDDSGSDKPQTSHEHRHDSRQSADKEKDRWMWQLPEQVLDSIGVVPGMTLADIGAGDGYFTFRAAQRVGNQGHVYATDISESVLQIIRARCQDEGVQNVTAVMGSPDDPGLPAGQIDLALLVNVIHLVDNPKLFLENVRTSLRPDGVLAIVGWEAHKLAAESPRGGPAAQVDEFDHNRLRAVLGDTGYEVRKTFTFLPLQDILMCYPIGGE